MELSRPDITAEDIAAVTAVLESGWIVGGPQQEIIETELSTYCGYAFGIAVNSWTTGAFLVLHHLGIGPGDEVLVPSYSFIATANVVKHVGATPVFVDVEPGSWNVDAADLHRKVTARTRAVIAVDQLGMPLSASTLAAIAELEVVCIRDSACSIGSLLDGIPVGGGADFAVTSFHARKILTSGEGGMIFTDDPEAANRLRRLKHQGMSLTDFERQSTTAVINESYPEVGYNFRLTDIQAALLVSQFRRLSETLARRTQVAAWYGKHLPNPRVNLPLVEFGVEPNWQSYQIQISEISNLEQRDALLSNLKLRGIPAKRGVMAAHLEPAYSNIACGPLPVTERAVITNITLPMHPNLTESDCAQVAQALHSALEEVLP
jgi:dTDP-4-amino-4,6-dideoxygalactose transaminase